MDGFRKPYEYEEEKRGLILLFIILILSIDTFMVISYIVQVFRILMPSLILSYGFMILGILLVAFTLFTAITCYKLKSNLVAVSKIYLAARAIYISLCITIILINAMNDKSMIGNGPNSYKSMNELVFTILVGPLVYLLLFSISWWLYFTKSKRCKELSMK